MTTADRIKSFLRVLPDNTPLAIDRGGLNLQVIGTDEYLEIGGEPDERPLPRRWRFTPAEVDALEGLRLASIGQGIAAELQLKRKPNGRWDLANGDKTDRGLALTVIRIIQESGEGWHK
jgi:hypothetical protein